VLNGATAAGVAKTKAWKAFAPTVGSLSAEDYLGVIGPFDYLMNQPWDSDDEMRTALLVVNPDLPEDLVKELLKSGAQSDSAGILVADKKGHPQPDADLRDYENVPLPTVSVTWDENVAQRLESAEYRAAVDDYVNDEVVPYVPEAWVDLDKTKIGYEVPLTRYFYTYVPPRPLDEIGSEIKDLEDEIQTLLLEATVKLRRVSKLVTNQENAGTLPYVALENVESWTGHLTTMFEDLETRASVDAGVCLVEPGDVLFGKLRPYLAKIWRAPERVYASTELMAIRGGRDVEPRWLEYLALSKPVVDWAIATSEGVKMPRTSWEKLGDFVIDALPSPVEQLAIADYLDAETARIDTLISKKQRIIELLQEGWFSIVETRMRELALEFGSIPLRYLVKCLDGARVPLSSEERGHREGPIPYYGASRVVDWIDSYIFNETLVLLGEDGAQLGNPRYEIAQVVSGKIWVNNHAHVLRPISVDPYFLTLLLNTFDRIQFISGGTREKITQDDMNRIPVPNLSPDDQKKEVQRLETRHIRCVGATDRLRRQITLLQERRQALITAAVTGQLDIPEVAA
jgi:type I restriction enzyme S subunit